MLNDKKEFRIPYGGKEITIETGRLAKQADGAVLVSCEDTQVLVTVCAAHEVKDGQDFFPLMVDYKEKFYSAGKFLGGFIKREGRPSNSEILLMRMIDRPLRPLFPDGFMFETIIMAQVLSYGESFDPQILAGIGASAAIDISDIPFRGPVGFCSVGKVNGELKLNLSAEERKESDLELVVAASDEAILMVEGSANELSEADMLEALKFAHGEIQTLCEGLKKMKSEVGREKRKFESASANQTLLTKVEENFKDKARESLSISEKMQRQNSVAQLEKSVSEAIKSSPSEYGLDENASFGKEAYKAVDELLYKMMRADIVQEEKRIGGRGLDQVRQIETEVGLLKKVHGSALFTRGETQVLSAVTVGGKEGEQMSDQISGISFDKFYLHYTFAPFSVGEARGYRGVGRREVGHGNLAERALRKVLPTEDFPYTVRVVCEVLESNGSSSMGSVCAGSMAMMEAGIPLKKPVAGVAMGLVKEGENFKVLTDILGDEDHLGDMDFKVAGTSEGITAIQMDIKISGITMEIFEKAMAQAKDGRLHILNEMKSTIENARPEFKEGVPQIHSFQIEQDKMGMLIGPGGKNIKGIQERFGVNVEANDDGVINILGSDAKKNQSVQDFIQLQLNGPKLGSEYDATVVSIKEYGAFVDLVPGVSGLVHVSELTDARVQDVRDYLKEGDEVRVKVLDVDRFGKIKLSAKAIKALESKKDMA